MNFSDTCRLIAQDLSADGGRANFGRFIKKYFRSAGFAMVVRFRLSHWLYSQGWLGRQAAQWLHLRGVSHGCHLSPTAKIGGGFMLPHPIGVVVGENASIGKNVILFHNVTLGRRSLKDVRYPTIMDNVIVYAGACLIGGITVGEGATIGANAVVLKNVEANTLVFGNPAKPRAAQKKK